MCCSKEFTTSIDNLSRRLVRLCYVLLVGDWLVDGVGETAFLANIFVDFTVVLFLIGWSLNTDGAVTASETTQ